MKTRKSIAALALLVLMGGALPITVRAQSSGLADYEKQSRETFKKQQKQAKKAGKKQFKAIQKAQEKQAKAYKKSLEEQTKHGLTL
jgi:hypothetical protein